MEDFRPKTSPSYGEPYQRNARDAKARCRKKEASEEEAPDPRFLAEETAIQTADIARGEVCDTGKIQDANGEGDEDQDA